MGHTAISIGAIALATGVICLLCGYLWGRSNLKSHVEDAVEQARRSADAREFDLMEQLSSKMAEVAELRAHIDEVDRLQQQPGQKRAAPVSNSTPEERRNRTPATPKLPVQKPAPVVDSTEKTIQNYLKSLEEKLNQPEEEPQRVAPKIPSPPANQPFREPPVVARKSAPPPPKLPDEKPRPIAPQSPRPSAQSPVGRPAPAVKDEWQEFAASLEALRSRQK